MSGLPLVIIFGIYDVFHYVALTERCWQVLLELRRILDHPTSPRVRHLDCAQGRAGTQQRSGTPHFRVKMVIKLSVYHFKISLERIMPLHSVNKYENIY